MSYDKIGICGQLGVGKDATAGYLALEYGHTPFAFADELKRHIREITGIYDEAKVKAMAQRFGPECRELFGADVWVNALERKMASLRVEKVVITDLRQRNEYRYLREHGYTIIRVEAPVATRLARLAARDGQGALNSRDFDHATETEAAGFDVDYTVDNSGDLRDLAAQVDDIMREVAKGAR